MKKIIYGTYRPERIYNPLSLGNGVSLNGTYLPSFFVENMFADYSAAGLTKILDSEIPEDRYVAEIAPGIPKLTRFIIGEYDELHINGADFAKSVAAVGARFQIEMFATAQETIDWIKANTNLLEETPGKFVLSEAHTDMYGNPVPAKYLEIV